MLGPDEIVPRSGPFVVEDIAAQLNLLPFAEWPVARIIACPQPKVYAAGRKILAGRMLPYLARIMKVLDHYDITMDIDRLDFVTDTMDGELAEIVDRLGLPTNPTNVLLGYCAGAKKIRRMLMDGQGTQTGHDMMVGLGASARIQADVLSLLGFKMVPRAEGSKFPLDHSRLKLP